MDADNEENGGITEPTIPESEAQYLVQAEGRGSTDIVAQCLDDDEAGEAGFVRDFRLLSANVWATDKSESVRKLVAALEGKGAAIKIFCRRKKPLGQPQDCTLRFLSTAHKARRRRRQPKRPHQ